MNFLAAFVTFIIFFEIPMLYLSKKNDKKKGKTEE